MGPKLPNTMKNGAWGKMTNFCADGPMLKKFRKFGLPLGKIFTIFP